MSANLTLHYFRTTTLYYLPRFRELELYMDKGGAEGEDFGNLVRPAVESPARCIIKDASSSAVVCPTQEAIYV